VLGVAAVDVASIAFTTFRLSEVATTAATDAVTDYRANHRIRHACDVAEASVADLDPDARLTRCDIDRDGTATVTLRKVASTFLASRLDFLSKYARVTRTESASRPSL
jgi:hypothetical protein